MKKVFYVNVAGGMGYNCAFASWVAEYKTEHPDEIEVYVTSPYADLFEACSAIDGVYKPNEIRDFIFDANSKGATLVMHRLYDMDGFIKKQLNYSEAWSDLLGLPRLEKTPVAAFDLITTKFPATVNQRDGIVKAIKDKGFEDFVIMQFTGGQSPLVQVPAGIRKDENGNDVRFPDWSKVQYNYENEPLKRHYPIEKAQEFADAFMKEHPKTAIIAYQLPNEPAIRGANVLQTTVPYLVYNLLAKDDMCRGIVSIDSSLPHITAGLTKTVVIWAHSTDKSFGYDYNKNILQDCRRDDILYFTALGASGARVDYIKPQTLLKEVDEYLYNDTRKDNE